MPDWRRWYPEATMENKIEGDVETFRWKTLVVSLGPMEAEEAHRLQEIAEREEAEARDILTRTLFERQET